MAEEKTVLHMVRRQPAGKGPNPSPFVVKLETFLRMANVPHEVSYEQGTHSVTGKTPWLSYKGERLADSALILQRLQADEHALTDKSLSKEQLAIGRFLQKMIDENTYWPLVLHRWVYSSDGLALLRERGMDETRAQVVEEAIKKKMTDSAWGHGIGRFAKEEVTRIGLDDLAAMSSFLGAKRFFMGDEPHAVDCSAFGLLCVLLYSFPQENEMVKSLRERHANLVDYTERMKERFYPDWNDL